MITAEKISKRFNNRVIFQNLSLELKPGEMVAVTGENGSGKSTLLKTLAGFIKQDRGTIIYKNKDTDVTKSAFTQSIGYVAPYLNLYEEFSPVEFLRIYCKMRNIKPSSEYLTELFRDFRLFQHKDRQIKDFSSGMKQRVKYIAAFVGLPTALFLDEPSANLDSAGFDAVKMHIEKSLNQNIGVIIASNDEREYEMAGKVISIMDYL